MDLDHLRREIPPRLQAALGARYRGAILFGSRARGDASPDSDIDVLVLLDDPVRLGPDGDAIIRALYSLQIETDVPIHAIPAGHASYEAGAYALYRHARSEGIALWVLSHPRMRTMPSRWRDESSQRCGKHSVPRSGMC